MSDIKWIKITTNVFDDEKIRLIETLPDADTILVIWFKLLAMAGRCNDCGLIYLNRDIPYTDEMLSTLLGRPVNTVRLAMREFENLKMIEICNNFIAIMNWEKHQNIDGMEKIREQSRKRSLEYRKRLKGAGSFDYNNNYTLLKDRDGESCAYCGSKENLCIDHLIPLVKGGDNKIENLALSCKSCNSGKSGRTIEESKYEIINTKVKEMYIKTRDKITRSSRSNHATDKNRIDKNRIDNIYSCEYFCVSKDKHSRYEEIYKFDLLKEYKKMKIWLDDNPKRRKKDYNRFISNWLSNCKEKEKKTDQEIIDELYPRG